MTLAPVNPKVTTMKLLARKILRYSGLISLSALMNPAFALDNKPTLIILDGSNSMWTQVDGKNKIVIARDSLDTLVRGAGSAPLGLVTYGGGCSNVKVVGRSGMSNEALLKAAKKLNPKGKSPITSALKTAANEVKNNGKILLVSDGAESCGGDPCAMATTLKKHYPDLVVDVLGFSAGDEAQLQCIAANTGGRFVLAQNTAAIGELFADLKPIIAEKAAAEASGVNLPPASSANAPTGKVQLSLGEKGKADTLKANYFIYTPDNQLVKQFTEADTAEAQIPAGTYKVNAIWKGFRNTHSITVKADETANYRFDLDSIGSLKIQSRNGQGDTRATYAIYDKNNKSIGNYVLLDQVNETLPAGAYRVKATQNQNSLETTLEVKPGSTVEHTFEFKANN